ncbi:MAG: hypothetical protein JSS72_01595 [Armatimonadetes bacterium]|nr:hypothetical protein [Armatimonadota bacterium]
MIQTYKRLGELLSSAGCLNQMQLSIALAEQRVSNRRLGEILIERGFVTEEQVAQCLADQYGYQIINPLEVEIEPDALRRLTPEEAVQLNALPISQTAAGLMVAIADPIDVVATDRLMALVRSNVILHVAPSCALARRIRSAYGLNDEFIPEAFPEADKAPKRYEKLFSRYKINNIALFDAYDSFMDRPVSLIAVPLDHPDAATCLEAVKASAKGVFEVMTAVYEIAEENGFRWVTLQRVAGENLDRILRIRGRRQLIQSAELVGKIAESLDDLQKAGGAGNWVCAQNIFMGARGPVLVPFVAPPEHYRSPSAAFDGDNPGASTAFALGSLLKDCCYGFNQKPEPYIPAPMKDILANCLASDSKDRFGSPIEVASALRSFNWTALGHSLNQNTAQEREHLLDTIVSEPVFQPKQISIIDRILGRNNKAA